MKINAHKDKKEVNRMHVINKKDGVYHLYKPKGTMYYDRWRSNHRWSFKKTKIASTQRRLRNKFN